MFQRSTQGIHHDLEIALSNKSGIYPTRDEIEAANKDHIYLIEDKPVTALSSYTELYSEFNNLYEIANKLDAEACRTMVLHGVTNLATQVLTKFAAVGGIAAYFYGADIAVGGLGGAAVITDMNKKNIKGALNARADTRIEQLIETYMPRIQTSAKNVKKQANNVLETTHKAGDDYVHLRIDMQQLTKNSLRIPILANTLYDKLTTRYRAKDTDTEFFRV